MSLGYAVMHIRPCWAHVADVVASSGLCWAYALLLNVVICCYISFYIDVISYCMLLFLLLLLLEPSENLAFFACLGRVGGWRVFTFILTCTHHWCSARDELRYVMRQVLRHELRYVVYMYTCTCTGGCMRLCIYIHRNFNNMESSNTTLVMPPSVCFLLRHQEASHALSTWNWWFPVASTPRKSYFDQKYEVVGVLAEYEGEYVDDDYIFKACAMKIYVDMFDTWASSGMFVLLRRNRPLVGS